MNIREFELAKPKNKDISEKVKSASSIRVQFLQTIKLRNCLKINLKLFFNYFSGYLWLYLSKNSGLFERNKGANRQKRMKNNKIVLVSKKFEFYIRLKTS